MTCYNESTMQKTERLVAITLLLQARGKMTAERLATILEVSPRTIYRDMDALSLAHLPVSMDYGPGGGYYLPEGYRLDPATFTSDEAVALALGGAMAGGYRLFESDDGLRRALVKLEAALPDEYRADVRAARERIFFDTTAWHHRQPAATAHLETVRAAVWTARQLDLLYPSSDGSGAHWRRVEPHGLVCKAGIWYLVAYCHLRTDFRTFRVERIEEIGVRDEPVTPRPGFDLQTFWEESRRRFEEQTMPLALTLRVDAATLRRLRGGVTVLEEDADGTRLVRLDAESVEAAVSYALSLGPGAVVLAPERVREAVAAAAQAMAGLYPSPLSA
jgi:predicted DNA-binding transcriptional regulator YafY